MSACHRKDQSVTIDCDNVPRAGQTLRFRRFVSFLIETFLSCSDYSQHFLCRDVDLTNGVILSVTQVQVVLVLSKDVADALRVMKLCLAVAAIYQANLAVTDLVLKLHRIFIDHHESVVGCVGHHDQVAI